MFISTITTLKLFKTLKLPTENDIKDDKHWLAKYEKEVEHNWIQFDFFDFGFYIF
jgi:hypothetical protein